MKTNSPQSPEKIADFLRCFRAHGVEQGWLEREVAAAADRRAAAVIKSRGDEK